MSAEEKNAQTPRDLSADCEKSVTTASSTDSSSCGVNGSNRITTALASGPSDDMWAQNYPSGTFSILRQPYRNVSHLDAVACISCSMLCDMSRQVGVLSVFPRGLSYVVATDRSPPPVRTTTWVSGGHYYYLSVAERCVCRQTSRNSRCLSVLHAESIRHIHRLLRPDVPCFWSNAHLSKEEETPPPKGNPSPTLKKDATQSIAK
jgi:hypothetical protein